MNGVCILTLNVSMKYISSLGLIFGVSTVASYHIGTDTKFAQERYKVWLTLIVTNP